VEFGDLPKTREQLAVLEKLCPQGCEERKDFEKVLATTATRTNLSLLVAYADRNRLLHFVKDLVNNGGISSAFGQRPQ
jgi:hypothetical protein